MKIAVDGMGADRGPSVIVDGVIQAARQYGHEIYIVGDQDILSAELKKHKDVPAAIHIRHASEQITMEDSPAAAIRKKKDSSIAVGVGMARDKEVEAFVSPGNTGAVVCAATLFWGLLHKVERPGIAIVFPTPKGPSMVIDVGANIAPTPMHLLQYAIMADAYSRCILNKQHPTVGLLNVGEEATKGTDFVKETYKLISDSNLNFIGNVEGRDIFMGNADIIVCDGFVGNVVLKVAEGIGWAMSTLLKRQLKKNIITKLGAILSIQAFRGLSKEIDYTEYGGAPLLGVDGRCIICHGSSNAKAIKNAVRVAGEFLEHHVNQHIIEELEKIP